jgi:hypothetical protein
LIGRLATVLKWIILLPVLVAALLLAVANTQTIDLHLNPFDSGDPVLTKHLALYQLAFVVFVAGALIGGLIVWLNQHKYRRRARLVGEDLAQRPARAERGERHDEAAGGAAIAAYLPKPERG